MTRYWLFIVSILIHTTILAYDGGQGRSLDDILKQHGRPLEAGKTVVITANGILTDDLESSKRIVKLQHRIANLIIPDDEKFTENFLKNFDQKKDQCGLVLIAYIQKMYGNSRQPLFAFVEAIIKAQHEINLIRTEALNLLSDRSCSEQVGQINKQIDVIQKKLIAFENAFVFIWQALIAVIK